MTSFKEWFFSQVISRSLGPSRKLSGSENTPSDETPCSVSGSQLTQVTMSQGENSSGSSRKKNLDILDKVEALKIKFYHLLWRFHLSKDNLTVAKVLYRINLATLIRAGESDIERASLRNDIALATSAQQDERSFPVLDFSIKILVLGKTGVGKSSTINSIFGDSKVMTDAFQPATGSVHDICGIVNGIKVNFIDTPGLLPCSTNSDTKNRKILHSIKRFIQKSCPDVVLYFERLDLINVGYCDFPLLKLITEILGPSIWFSTSIVMTHSCAALPENENGYPVSYDSFVSYCTEIVQHNIHQAILDNRLENPVILVENHPYCKVDISGKKILPNGQRWVSHFMLLCICTKILGDINRLLDFEGSIQLGPVTNSRLPSLPHLLSSFLKHHVKLSLDGVESELDAFSFSNDEDEEEYDQLPPIHILTSAQFQNLTPSQKKEYLDELDFRETLYLKKQMKEEYIRRRDKNNGSMASENDEDNQGLPGAIVLPDMALPLSFDSHSPVHRYRCLVTGDQWQARPVLDPHGWDHDVGFDGVNLEIAANVRKHYFSCFTGQLSKDKREFNIRCEPTAAFLDPRGPTYSICLDLQSAGRELMCSLHSNTKLPSFKSNITECGFAVTSFGDKYYYGAKIEDAIILNKRMKLKANIGRMAGSKQVAYGGNIEATLNGKDYPVRHDKLCIAMSILSYKNEMVLGANLQREFRLCRGTNMSVSANMNSRRMGQVCLKFNTSDHLEIALVAIVSIFRGLMRKKSRDRRDI